MKIGKFWRVVLLVLAGILVVIALVLVAVHNAAAKQYVKDQIEERAKTAGIKIASLDYNLFSGQVVLTGFQAGPASEPYVKAGRIHAALNTRSLVRGRLEIENADVSGLELNLIVDENGKTNFAVSGISLPGPSEAAGTAQAKPPFKLPGFLIAHLNAAGSLNFQHKPSGVSLKIPAWKLQIEGHEGPVHGFQLNSTQAGQLVYQSRMLPVNDLLASGSFTRTDLTIQNLNLAAPSLTVNLSGTLEGFSNPKLNLNIEAGSDLEPLLNLTGMNLRTPIEGLVRVSAQTRGPVDELAVSADIGVLGLKARGVSNINANARLSWDRSSQAVRIASGVIQAPQGTARFSGEWAGTTPQSQNRLTARLENIDLPRVFRALGIATALASRVDGTLNANWTGTNLEQAQGNGLFQLTPARNEVATNAVPASGTVRLDLKNRQLSLAAESLEALGVDVDAEIRTVLPTQLRLYGQVPVAGRLTANIDSLVETVRGIRAFQGPPAANGPLLIGGQAVSGQIAMNANLSGTLNKLTASFSVQSSHVEYGPLKDLSVNIAADYAPERVSLTNAAISWNGSQISAGGYLNLTGQKELMLNASASDIPIADVLAVLGTKYPVAGRVALGIRADGTLSEPRAEITLRGENLSAYDQPLGELTAALEFANPTVTVHSLELERPDDLGALKAEGSFNLDTKQYTASISGNSLTLHDLQIPGAQALSGVVNLTASGSGTLDNPLAQFSLNLRNLTYGERMLASIETTGTVENQRVHLTVEAPKFNAAAEVQGGIQAPYPVSATLNLNNTGLASLPWGGEPPVKGRITAEVRARGDLENWKAGEASFTIPDLHLDTPAGEIANAVPIELAYQNRTVQVESARLAGPMSSLLLEGRLPWDPSQPEGTLRYQGQIDLAGILPDQFKTSGQVTVSGELHGSFERFEPVGAIAVRNGSVKIPAVETPIQNIQAAATLENGRLKIQQVQATLASGTIAGQGTIPLSLFPLPELIEVPRMSQPAEFDLTLKNLSLNTLAALPEDVNSATSLRVHVQAPRPELAAIQGTVIFDELNLQVNGIALAPVVPPEIALNGQTLTIQQFALQGGDSRVNLTGSLSLPDLRLRGVELSGNFDAALAETFISGISAGGPVRAQITASGPVANPDVNGTVELSSGRFSIPNPRIDVANVDARLKLNQQRVVVEKFSGEVNGGTLNVSGSIDVGVPLTPNLTVTARDVNLNFPAGLRTLNNVNLRFTRQGEFLQLAGNVNVIDGAYTQQIDLPALAESYLQSGGVSLVEQQNEILSRLRFDIAVNTNNPITMDNNLGKLALNAQLRVVGNYYRPGLLGRIDVEEGGTLRLQENQYVIDQVNITFVNEAKIEPLLNVQASTQVRGRTLTINITTNERGELTTDFSSDNPEDTRADIIALLLTGRTASDLQGSQANLATQQVALSLLAGTASGRLSEQLQKAVGLSTVRIDPVLISPDADPNARLTVGQQITAAIEMIYSMNLRDSSDQIWILSYEPFRRFVTRATRQSDASYRFDLQHDLRFGGTTLASITKPRPPRKVGTVQFAGNLAAPQEPVAKKFGVKSGSRYDFFRIRKGIDKLQSYYLNQGYLEAQVRLRSDEVRDKVDLTIFVEPGPRVQFVYEGWSPSGGERERIQKAWRDGAFQQQRVSLAVDAIQTILTSQGYFKPEVQPEVSEPEPGMERVIFTVYRGIHYNKPAIVWEGAQKIEAKTLEKQLNRAGYKRDKLISQSRQAQQFLAKYYQQEGFLDARVTGPDLELNPATRTAKVTIIIDEGSLYHWGQLATSGAKVFSPAEIRALAGVKSGTVYTTPAARDAVSRIEEAYWKKGYRDVLVSLRGAKQREEGIINATATISEGPQTVVKGIRIEGTDQTSDAFIKKNILLEPGQPLDYSKTNESRRVLYNTEAFNSVELRTVPEEPTGSPAAAMPPAENANAATPDIKYVNLLARVQEKVPFELQYGLFYDTDRGPGAIVNFWNRNTLGEGRTVGARFRYDGTVHEARVFFTQPLARSRPIRTDTSFYIQREIQSTFNTDRIGATVQETMQLRNRFLLSLGYRFERAHTYDTLQDVFIPFDQTLRVAPLTASVVRETRDALLDPTSGSFFSQALDYSAAALGSSFNYISYFGQYFYYLPLTSPAPVPFGHGVEKPRVIFATGIRVGLAHPFGGFELPRAQRFFAGGSTSIRGFQQDGVGPTDVLGRPEGGDALLVINNELRFPLYKFLDGTTFLDIGNVYPTISDFSLLDVRSAAGVGLRVRTPYVLLRLDYGLKLDRRVGESRGAWYFSIGQAF
jgi:outer membrane protein assembly complex protein YaeT